MTDDTTRIRALSRLCAADCIGNGLTLDHLDEDWDVWESDVQFIEEEMDRCLTSDELRDAMGEFRRAVEAYFSEAS